MKVGHPSWLSLLFFIANEMSSGEKSFKIHAHLLRHHRCFGVLFFETIWWVCFQYQFDDSFNNSFCARFCVSGAIIVIWLDYNSPFVFSASYLLYNVAFIGDSSETHELNEIHLSKKCSNVSVFRRFAYLHCRNLIHVKWCKKKRCVPSVCLNAIKYAFTQS